MNRKIMAILTVVTVIFMLCALTASGQTPNLVTYQGKLTNNTGSPITGTTTVIFSLYGAADSIAGAVIWAETLSVSPDNSGFFTVQLGKVHPADRDLFNGARLWLGIKAGTDAEMTPRQPVNSAPYSLGTWGGGNISVGSPHLSGNLYVYKAGTSYEVIHGYGNNYGGNIDLFDENTSFMAGLEADIDGAGGYLTVNRGSGSGGFTVDGNYSGSGEPLVGIYGTSRVAIFNMNATGSASVMLPDGSISSSEILDDPGIAQAKGAGSVTVANTGITSLTSRQISTPGAGYVIAYGFGYAALGSSSGTTMGNILVGVDTLSTNYGTDYEAYGANSMSVASGTFWWSSVVNSRVFYFPAAVTKTFYLNAGRGYADGIAYVYQPKILLMFIPSSYGVVTSTVATNETSQFDQATPVSIGGAASGEAGPVREFRNVDLRELELKAVKAQAEAEKAQKELYQAQMEKQLQESRKHSNNATQEK